MKNLLKLLLVIGIVFTSCQDDSSILQSEGDLDGTTILIVDENFEEEMDVISEYSEVRSILARTYTVVGDSGGKIIEKHTWTNGTETIMLEAYLTIPAGAFEDTLTFDMVFDPNLLSVELRPTPFTFNIPVMLDLQFKGISEDYDINPDSLDFKYYKVDGTFEDVNFKNIIWLPQSRTIKVFDAELHHFSRYGWTRTKPGA